jgi:putative membrane protein
VTSYAWTFSPTVIALLAASSLLYVRGAVEVRRRGGTVRALEALSFAGGQVAIVAALLSPIDTLKDLLFSAHMGQHELLMLVAAPLYALAKPLSPMLFGFPRTVRGAMGRFAKRIEPGWHALTHPAVALLLHAAALWIWHLPALYQAALADPVLHGFQHFTFFVTAALFWWAMVHGGYGRVGYGVAVLFVFLTATHSSILGALLTFAGSLWYPVYASGAHELHVDPLRDQQLAGLLMWVPAGAIFTLMGLGLFAAWLGQAERRVQLGSADELSRALREPP